MIQKNEPYAEETSRPIKKVATYTKTYEKQVAKQFYQDEILLNHITETYHQQ
jgi:hypothetical protein